MEASCAGHVEIGFVNRCHLDQRRKRREHTIDFLGAFAIALRVAIHEDGVRTELGRRAQRHGRMHAEFARFVGCSGDNTTLVALASDDHGFAFERGIEQLFHRDEERVHVDVKDGLAGRGHRRGFLSAIVTARTAHCCQQLLRQTVM